MDEQERDHLSVSKTATSIFLAIIGAFGAGLFLAVLDAHLKINQNSDLRERINNRDIVAQVIANTDLRKRIAASNALANIDNNSLFRDQALKQGWITTDDRDKIVDEIARLRARITELEKTDERLKTLMIEIGKSNERLKTVLGNLTENLTIQQQKRR